MTLWDTIVAGSSLPEAIGNTFWDHLNNQSIGTGTRITLAELDLELTARLDMELAMIALEMELRERMDLELGFPRMELELS